MQHRQEADEGKDDAEHDSEATIGTGFDIVCDFTVGMNFYAHCREFRASGSKYTCGETKHNDVCQMLSVQAREPRQRRPPRVAAGGCRAVRLG